MGEFFKGDNNVVSVARKQVVTLADECPRTIEMFLLLTLNMRDNVGQTMFMVKESLAP